MDKAKKAIQFGEVYWMEFEGQGHVQRGLRPGVVIQNNIGNKYSPNIIAVPTTTKTKASLPTHVFIPAIETGMAEDCVILCENPITIPKSHVRKKITTLPEMYLRSLSKAALISMPFNKYISD